MPDTSLMLDLCNELEISVNELLSGEMIDIREYNKVAEENLLEMAKREEQQNKKMMMYEMVIGTSATISFLFTMLIAEFLVEEGIYQHIIIAGAFVILLVGVFFALKIETETGYYECGKCHHKYVPTFKAVFWAMHYGTTRYLKCPECHKRSWNKKVMSKM